jgi:ATP-dependent Clp protease ATP-binding subunit ClpC
MAERELQLELSEGAKDLLVDKGWDPAMGARPLRRAIQRYIEDPLADFVLREQVPGGSTVMVDASAEQQAAAEEAAAPEDEVKLTVIAPKPKPTPVGVGAEGGSRSEEDSPAEEPNVPDAPQDGE